MAHSSQKTTQDLPEEFVLIRQLIGNLPAYQRHEMLAPLEKMEYFIKVQARLVKLGKDAIDSLKLDVKYLQFDVEASRRERDELRKDCEALWRKLDGEE